MDRQEVWEHAVEALEREFTSCEFEEGEFRVVHNKAMGTITIIENWTKEALTLLDATGGMYTLGGVDDKAVVVEIPLLKQHV